MAHPRLPIAAELSCRNIPVRVQNLMMSCRVLGRGVEAKMLSHVGTIALEHDLPFVQVRFRPTERNEPARRFLEKHLNFPKNTEACEVPSTSIAAVTFNPSDASVEEPSARGAVAEPLKAAERNPENIRTARGEPPDNGFGVNAIFCVR